MMFSGGSFCEFGFSEQEWAPAGSSAFQDFLEDVTAERCFLLELDVLSLAITSARSSAFGDAGFGELGFSDADAGAAGGVQRLRFSTHGYTSRPTDLPANTWHDGRMTNEIQVDRSIAGRSGIGGLARIFAECTLVNADGALDTLTRDYAIDGRTARILAGRPSDALADFGVIFTGVAQTPTISTTAVQLSISDGIAKLEPPINPDLYTGAGGLEGGADLAGKPKPVGYGACKNISPPLVDSVKLIYQVHDDAISDVSECYDRRIALTQGADYGSAADMQANAPAAGNYRVWPGGGFIRLGSTPAGTVTCNLLGDATGAGYADRTADILLRVLVDRALLYSSEIEPLSFTVLNTDAPAAVGIWIGTDTRSIADVVDELLASVGAFGGFSRSGNFAVAVLAEASGTPQANYTEEDIVEIEREPLPAPVDPIVWRAIVGYAKNYTVQSDLAAAVTAADRTFAAQEFRTVSEDDSAIRSRHRLAVEFGPTASLYSLEADATDEVQRLFELWSTPRALFRVRAPFRALLSDLGRVVGLTHSRHGLAAGKSGRVIRHTVTNGTEVEMRVLV